MSIGIIGAGAFGTALAQVFASDGSDVVLYGRSIDEMRNTGENRRYLPGIRLAPSISPTDQIEELTGVNSVLLAIPAQQTAAFLSASGTAFANVPLVLCAKGISKEDGQFQSEIAGRPAAVLTGPGFATEIGAGCPTAMTLAAPGDMAQALQAQLARPTLRIYRTDDVIGAQIGGAVKNVIAIACGAAIGAGLGESARAALMTRGFAEMTRLGRALGARDETLTGLSGLGDLALTCGSEKSRNFRFGQALGSGETAETVTVEGRATARAIAQLCTAHDVDMPICAAVGAVIDHKLTVQDAMRLLLERPSRKEDGE